MDELVDDVFGQVVRRPLRSLSSVLSEIIHKVDKNGELDCLGNFAFARAVYHHCLTKLEELGTGNNTELNGSHFYSLVLGEYVLYGLYRHSGGLEDNPFLIHFICLYNRLIEVSSTDCNLGRLLYGILLQEEEVLETLDQSTCTNITQVRDGDGMGSSDEAKEGEGRGGVKGINVTDLRRILKNQWINDATIDKVMSMLDPLSAIKQLERVYDSNEDHKTTINELVDRIIANNRQSGEQESIPDKFLNPFTSTSAEIFQRFLISPNIRGDYRREIILQLSRAKATNVSVDFIHMIILGGLVEQDDMRLLVYEFVLFNLQSDKLTENIIKLICTFILALHDKGILKPDEEYQMLYSSFINWIGVVSEAREVYLLRTDEE